MLASIPRLAYASELVGHNEAPWDSFNKSRESLINSTLAMLIQVKIDAARARAELAMVSSQLEKMQARVAAASAAESHIGLRGAQNLTKFGSRLQWAGRQLSYNFTLPLLLAAGAATKWELANQKASVNIAKVYGDINAPAATLTAELGALDKAFEALSNKYGVQRTEVLDVAAAWAQAGVSGRALAESVDLSLQAMILGEMDSTKATQSLIAIQAQYGASTSELNTILAELNIVENQTGISLAGLIEGFTRAAGVARTAGVSSAELAALLAALSPAAGSAAQAGNALKTIFSRMIAPTKQASDVIALMGINTNDLAWKTANGTERLKIMAKAFQGLSSDQQGFVSSVIASRYQINRFDVLMRELAPGAAGFYAKAVQATANQTDIFRQKQKELNQVLDSQPQKLKQIGVILQNSLADIIQPLIPVILNLARGISTVVTWFSNLSPQIQQAVGIFLLLVAILGPVVQYIGAIAVGIGVLGRGFFEIVKAVGSTIKFFSMLVATPFAVIGRGISAIAVALWEVAAATAGAVAAGLGWIWTQVFVPAATAALSFVWGILNAFLLRSLGLMAFWATGVFRGLAIASTTAAETAVVVWTGASTALVTVTEATTGLIATLWTGLVGISEALFIGMAARIGIIWRALIAFLSNPAAIFARIGALFAGVGGIIAGGFAGIIAALTSVPGIILAIIVAVILMFHDQIKQVFDQLVTYFQNLPGGIASGFMPLITFFHNAVDAIKKAFYSLPLAVQDAFKAVLKVVEASAKAVYQLFSYLNPFAHHSPSLVENTQKGMQAVGDHHQAASQRIQDHIGAAHAATSNFGKATAGYAAQQDALKASTDRAQIGSVAPSALPQYDAMIKIMKVLKADLAAVTVEVNKQQTIVDVWKSKLDAANAALQTQQTKLEELKKVQSDWSTKLDAAKSQLSDWAATPIQGMKAMGDAIFSNTQEQNKLQLQLLQMKQAGGGIDDITNKLAALNGEQEILRGTQADLRNSGAGSDILGPIGDQITMLDQQKKALQDQLAPLNDLQTQLDKLATEGQILDLTNSLQFDPLKKQIDDAANSMKEMPFDQILAGVKSSAAAVADLTVQYDAATAAVDAQQAVVDKLAAARDLIQSKYDAESASLDKLKTQYDDINNAIQDITSSISDMTQAASAAAAAKAGSGGIGGASAATFAAGAGGNLPNVGGTGSAIRTDWSSQVPDINKFTSDIANQVSTMFGSFNLFQPIKDKWNEFTAWWKKTINPAVGVIGGAFSAAFAGVDWGAAFAPIADHWNGFWKGLTDVLSMIWDLIGKPIIDIFKSLWQGIIDVATPVINEIKTWGDLFQPFLEAVGHLWNFIQPTLQFIMGIILLLGNVVLHVLGDIIGPVFSAVGQVIGGALRIIHGAIKFFLDLINGDWSGVWGDILDVLTGTWEAIWGVISNGAKLVWGIISGFVSGIVDFFTWLYDVLIGHSIIPDMVNGIIFWFQFMWTIVQVVWNAFMAIINVVAGVVLWFWNTVLAPAFAAIGAIFMWLWNSVVIPVFDGIKAAFGLVWAAISFYVNLWMAIFRTLWGVISSVAGWIWDKLQLLGGFFGALYAKYVAPFVTSMMTGFQNIWNKVLDVAGWITGKFTDVVTFFTGMPGKIANAVVGMWDGIKNSFKNVLNAIIGWWNDLSFTFPSIDEGPIHIGGWTWSTPNLPLFANGGLTKGMSIAGEGRYPEWIIPTDPSMHGRALSLLNDATASLYRAGGPTGIGARGRAGGVGAGSATVAVSHHTTNNVTLTGDLVFPNVQNEEDAKAFIENLASLAKGA